MEIPKLAVLGSWAVVTGIVVAAWRYIKVFFSYLISLFIVSFEAHEMAGKAVEAYCSGKGKPTPFGVRMFIGWKEFVRPHNRREGVIVEAVGSQPRVFWFGWRPLIVSRTSSTGNAERDGMHVQHRPVSISFIRFFFIADKLLLAAMEYYNERHRTRGGSRYYVSYVSGTAGKPAQMMMGAGREVEAPLGSPGSQADDFVHHRILQWAWADLGPQKYEEDALGAMALSDAMAEMVEEVRRWLASRQWFLDHSVPWSMGWLFHGLPGNGKTALARAIAQDFDLPIFQFDLGTFYNDEFKRRWQASLTDVPCIALVDDIDMVYEGRKTVRGDLGFDCFLNCLDGVDRSDGVITIVSTNKVETLDSALGGIPDGSDKPTPRPGRIDRVLEFTCPTEKGRFQLCQRILKSQPETWEETVAAGDGESGAQFQWRCTQKALDLYYNK